jgi:probable rRNA maturation factor
MTLALDFQLALSDRGIPPAALFEAAANAALAGFRARTELTIRVVARPESRRLNRRYRAIDKATNVLSFPAQGLNEVAPDYLGDVVICSPLVLAQARTQGKSREAHFSHLVVHGVLHLLGFDHRKAGQANIMEDRERAVLSGLGIADPYAI